MSTKYPVRTAVDGAIRGDGSGTRTFTTAPKAPGHLETMNAGRHSSGQSLANVGAQRGGQGEPGGNRPITGVSPSSPIRSMAPRPSIPANQVETSKDLEARLRANPQPFTYEGGAATLRTDRHDGSTEGVHYNVMAPVNARPQSYGSPVMSKQEMSDAVGGGMPTTGYNAINSGFPTRGNERQAGRPGKVNAGTSSRDNSRMRQE
jgi:hypothetical protein